MFVNIGFGNFINSSQIVSICRADFCTDEAYGRADG